METVMSLSFILMCILLLTFYGRSFYAFESKNIILTLTKENFTQTITENEVVFINFCIPWCKHCTMLESELEKAAKEVIQHYPRIKFAEVDVSTNDELAEEHKIHSYPTLRLFRNTFPVEYDREPTATDIIAWLFKKQDPTVKHLIKIEEIKRFQKEIPIVVIGIFKDLQTQKAQNFYDVAAEMEDYTFAVISDNTLIEMYNEDVDSISLYKNIDKQKIVYQGPNNLKDLKIFIELNSLPPIIEFEHTTASKILRGPTKAFLLFFISNQDNHLAKYIMPLHDLAIANRYHVLFVTITYDDGDKKRIYEHFDIMKGDTPSMRLIEFDENEELIKYKPNTKKISVKTVDDFIQQYIEGILTRYYKSQILSDSWNENNVITLVGTNFWTFVLDDDRTILVAFLAPWCGHCKLLEPIIENLAQKLKDNDEFFVAKIDATSNEIENLKISVFPTIKLFLKYNNKIIDYSGTRTLEGLETFLAQYGVTHIEKDEL